MSDRLLRPNPHRQKIICLTQTERWLSVIRYHADSNQRVAALNLTDLAVECRNWPRSAAIIEVNEVNLEVACRFALDRPDLLAQCGLFAVTDLSSADAINALGVAGYQSTCRSPLSAERLFRQIQRFHDLHPPDSLEIESAFGQRLPWKAVGRYADDSFKRTRFSNLPIESTQLTDPPTDAENLND